MSAFEKLVLSWPSAVVARSEVGRFSGGLLTSGSMANHDCLGTGPRNRIRCGRKVVYDVQSLIEWMEARTVKLDK
jgi:hypothetical protein